MFINRVAADASFFILFLLWLFVYYFVFFVWSGDEGNVEKIRERTREGGDAQTNDKQNKEEKKKDEWG